MDELGKKSKKYLDYGKKIDVYFYQRNFTK